MQNLFGLCHLNKFRIMSEYDPFIFNCIYCTFSLCFTLYIFGYLKTSEFLVIFFSLLIFLIKFIVSYIISFSCYRQTNFSHHTNSFYSVCLHIYSEILYAKICRSCSRYCTEHIRVVLPKYAPYSFSNMICIFLHFFNVIKY